MGESRKEIDSEVPKVNPYFTQISVNNCLLNYYILIIRGLQKDHV